MTLAEIALAVAFLAGAGLTCWIYTLTERGSTFAADVTEANRRSRWFLVRRVHARHWPVYLLLVAYSLAFGLLAPNL